MTPEQQQAIKTHLDAISVILYDDSNPDSLQTLEDIEREHNSYAISINTEDNLSCCFEIDTNHSI